MDINPPEPMDANELEGIGERLFGRVGWTVKIARLVGKDSSTVRRWRAGTPIEPAYAAIIRNYASQHKQSSWQRPEADTTTDAVHALKLIARAQALKTLGVPANIRIAESEEGLSLTLQLGDTAPLVAWQSSDGGFRGLDVIENALRDSLQRFSG